MSTDRPPKKRKIWTAQDDADLRYWHAFKYTDGKIAQKLTCSRRTILRQREAMNLPAVDHPAREGIGIGKGRRTVRHRGLGLSARKIAGYSPARGRDEGQDTEEV